MLCFLLSLLFFCMHMNTMQSSFLFDLLLLIYYENLYIEKIYYFSFIVKISVMLLNSKNSENQVIIFLENSLASGKLVLPGSGRENQYSDYELLKKD